MHRRACSAVLPLRRRAPARMRRWLSSRGSSLPVVNVAPFLARAGKGVSQQSLDAAKDEAARVLDETCRNHGFFFVEGHGIPPQTTARIREHARAFFEQAEGLKACVAMKDRGARGYQRLGRNVTQGQRDNHEAIDFFRELPRGHTLQPSTWAASRGYADHRDLALCEELLASPNLFPATPTPLRPVVSGYVEDMLGLGHALLQMMSRALNLPSDHALMPIASESFWGLRLIHYPEMGRGAGKDGDAGGVGCGAHTDYGFLTIINQDEGHTSLQVKGLDGEWISVQPEPGMFVCNIGDMVQLLTNGAYKSTPHRVIHSSAGSRISVPFFFEPNFDAVIEPLETPVEDLDATEQRPAEAVYFGDHLFSKISGNFTD